MTVRDEGTLSQGDIPKPQRAGHRLFSTYARADPASARYAESSFAFLDRVNQPYWERIRVELERWFAAFPTGEAARDLRSRFRKDDHGQHLAAWWELYLHRLFTRLGYEVDVHPELEGTPDHPDFRVRTPTGSFLVEAATTFSGVDDGRQHSRLEAEIMDAINQGSSDNFRISLEFGRIGTTMPSVQEIVRPIENWLAGLDPDTERGDAGESRAIDVRDWELDLTAVARAPQDRGTTCSLLFSPPILHGVANDVAKLRRTLDRKSNKYGIRPDAFLFAVLMPSALATRSAVEDALFGNNELEYGVPGAERWVRARNGFWTREAGPRASWVSGVITGLGILPGPTLVTRLPRIWPNPWATVAVDVKLPFPHSVGSTTGQVVHEDGGPCHPWQLLGVDRLWPGPEPPFVNP